MGGGTSGLFFGTKGAKHEYQYSLFPDRIRKDTPVHLEGSSPGLEANGTTQARLAKQLITASVVLQKCHEYHVGIISAQNLVDWLSFVVSAPNYRLDRQLRLIVSDAIRVLAACLQSGINSLFAFNRELRVIERKLHKL